MSTSQYYLLLKIWIALAVVLLPVLLSITAPYGRHCRKGWGPMIPNRFAWVVMEIFSLVVFVWFFLSGPNTVSVPSAIFFVLYTVHYINRSLIFPLRTRTSAKQMPLIIALFAVVFNLVNGYLNGYYFGTVSEGYSFEWLYDARFIMGGLMFLGGMALNLKSDNILLALRKGSKNGYSIPSGGMFRYISCPNFFGEIIEWTGFAIMTWSPAALAFAVWTIANLVPRALDHHNWYIKKFEGYPPERKALIPFVL